MSKKIIYLLSLLMALSLVFAGCKKNDVTNPGNKIPDTPDNTKPPTGDLTDGLFTDEDKLSQYAEKPVQESEIAKYYNGDYVRNPVITVVNGTNVVIFYEIRYQNPGAANDLALTGTNLVDIVYVTSADGGVSFDTDVGEIKYVGGSKTTDYKNSHASPIVFYDKANKKLVVVASAGIGLSSGVYNGIDKVSRLEYSVATIDDNGNIGAFGAWKPITGINIGSFKQFGTHSARGTVASDGKLLLPITLAPNNANELSYFGYVVYEGSINGENYNWTKKSSVVTMADPHPRGTFIPIADASGYIVLSVPNPDNHQNILKFWQGKGGSIPYVIGLQGSDGSAGTVVVERWFGKTNYNPTQYADGTLKTTKKQALLSHVFETEKRLALRLLRELDFRQQLNAGYELGSSYGRNSKSSSLDILSDGTIVMAAEVGVADPTVEDYQTFYIYFNRYTQAFLANKTGNNQ